MSTIEILNSVLGIGLTVLGWFAREIWASVKTLKDDLIQLKEDILIYYVRKDDFKEFKQELFAALQRIESKLDTKQDK